MLIVKFQSILISSFLLLAPHESTFFARELLLLFLFVPFFATYSLPRDPFVPTNAAMPLAILFKSLVSIVLIVPSSSPSS